MNLKEKRTNFVDRAKIEDLKHPFGDSLERKS
jgi:hypothetical protein